MGHHLAGFDQEGICYSAPAAVAVLEGRIEDDTFFAHRDDRRGRRPVRRAVWIKAQSRRQREVEDMCRLEQRKRRRPLNNFLTAVERVDAAAPLDL